MKFSILNKVAFRSMIAHEKLFFPYLIAVILLFSLDYIIQNLFSWFVTSIFSIAFGYLLGRLIFIALNRLTQENILSSLSNVFMYISGKLHRMNNNAVSLASIAILCSGVILVLGITVTTYRTMEMQIESVQPAGYTLTSAIDENDESEVAVNENFLLDIIDELSGYGELEGRPTTNQFTSQRLFD